MPQRRPNRVLGASDEEFWEFCRQGELRLQRCSDCRNLVWPPLPACEKCGSIRLDWEQISGRGHVLSWCTFVRPYYDSLPVPWDTILVELEEGPLFISNPCGFDNQDVTPNLQVKVAFIDCEDDAGLFRLPVFELAQLA